MRSLIEMSPQWHLDHFYAPYTYIFFLAGLRSYVIGMYVSGDGRTYRIIIGPSLLARPAERQARSFVIHGGGC